MTARVEVVRVCIESPLRGDVSRNVMYADACMLDSLERGEAPFLGHLLYPRVLDDGKDFERRMGIACHLAWLRSADVVALYTDLGVTEGMRIAIALAESECIEVQRRELGANWLDRIAERRATLGFFSASGSNTIN